MNKLIPFLAIASIVSLTACDDGTLTDDTDGGGTVDCVAEDTFPASGPLSAGDYTACAPYTGATVISYFPEPTCSGNWGIDVEVKGVAAGVNGFTYDYGDGAGGQYGEEHPMTDGATETNAWWDAFSVSLTPVTENQVDGTSTFHQCAANNGETLIWGFEALSVDDSSRADCVVVVDSRITTLRDEKIAAFYAYHSAADLSGCDVVTDWTAE